MLERQNARLLVLEDELNLGSTLVERLQSQGFDVTWKKSVAEAQMTILNSRFELALLDVGLPDGSGFQIAEKLRKIHSSTPIIFLTAYGNPEDRIHGLEIGAEDYIVKPFHLKELLLRIQNVLKHSHNLTTVEHKDGIELGQAKIYFSKFEALVSGKAHPLTHKECAVLKLLVDHRGNVVSRDEILNQVWSPDELDAFPTSRTVDNFVMRLRRLVEVDSENPKIIKSIRGVGYQLVD